MKKHHSKLLLCFTLILLISICSCGCRFLSLTAARYTPVAPSEEGSRHLDNPYQGFYHLYGYTLSNTYSADDTRSWCEKRMADDANQLMLLEINLRFFQTIDLSPAALEQVSILIEHAASLDKQLILRFLYDWDGRASSTEPVDIHVIYRHMEQVAAIINRYTDTVYLVQGLFIGNYGELHNSRFHTKEELRSLSDHLAAQLDPSIYLAVRTPAQRRTILQSGEPLSPASAFQGDLNSRLSLFNDGIMGNATDAGTYVNGDVSIEADPLRIRSREQELTYQEQLCNYVPNGGEVISPNPLNDPRPAIATLSRMHVSYLNEDYDTKVLDKWAAYSMNAGTSSQKVTALEYIRTHLGYRYVIEDSGLRFITRGLKKPQTLLTFTLSNTGFASACRRFEFTCILENTETGKQLLIPVNQDIRLLNAGSSEPFSVDLAELGVSSGSWRVSLKLWDPALSRPIYFANDGYEELETVEIGTLQFP